MMTCILSYVDINNDDDYVKYTLQLSWFTLPEPDPEPGLLTITQPEASRPEVKKCYSSYPDHNTTRSCF